MSYNSQQGKNKIFLYQMEYSLFMIALHVLSVALNIYVLAVISCGTDHPAVTKCDDNKYCTLSAQLLNVYGMVSSTCHSSLSDGELPVCFKASN